MSEYDPDNDIDTGPDETDADLLDDGRIELVRCPHCGEPVAEDTPQCPHCKQWITNQPRSAFTAGPWWWVVLAALGAVGFLLLYGP